MKQLNGIYNGPLVTIIIMGILFKKILPIGAKISLVFGISTYIFIEYILNLEINFLYLIAILFLLNSTIMMIIGYKYLLANSYKFIYNKDIEWDNVKILHILILVRTEDIL